MINIGIIGCGYWGPNLLRNLSDCRDCVVKQVSELDDSRISYINKKYPDIKTTKDHKDLFCDDIDAIVIATPASTHYSLAKQVIENKKHVLVEKPLAMSTKEAEELVALSKKNNCKLMVGHTFEYNGAVQELKRQIEKGTVGKPYYFYSRRLNFGIVRKDINVLWNLAPHDISILLYLIGSMPTMVSARGYDFIQKGIEDISFVVMHFPGDIVAHIQVSWLDPSKVRKMTVVGSEKMIIYDDMADSKIQIYDKGIKKQNISDSLGPFDDFGKYQLIKSAGDVTFPKIDFVEPLKEECNHFVDCINNNKEPLTNGEDGLKVVKILEAAQESMKRNGENIKL
ncbi:MAG: Gfo/Idh/MocA family oxidoreductase [Candidatus Zapsychrus exili]|nr:Gfo/Idh/MocA family oxidoreductase [Candidatus Zapsychrus exili]